MIRVSLIAAAVCAVLSATPALADDVTVGGLKIFAPWARATPKGAAVGGGYMTITNTGSAPDRLIGGAADIAARFEVHEMSMDNGVMKMRELANGLEIKPGEKVELKPGSYHVMFMGLRQQLIQGQNVKATLQFEKAGKVDVVFSIEGLGSQSPAPASGHTMPGMNMKH